MRRALLGLFVTLALAAPATAAAPASNGKLAFAAVAADRWRIDVVQPDGTGRATIAAAPGINAAPAWSPDGSRVAFVCGNFSICVANADGSGAGRLTDDGGWPGTWSIDLDPTRAPDGTRLAFASNRSGTWKIYVVNADGSGLSQLAGSGHDETAPAWSPDGTRIAFTANVAVDPPAENLDVYVMNADGTGARALASSAALERRPAWSPSGGRIVYERLVERRIDEETTTTSMHLWTMNPDGSAKKPLTRGKGLELGPAWAPDGSRVVYSTYVGASFDLHTTGRGLTAPTKAAGFEGMADWQRAPSGTPPAPAPTLPPLSAASGDALLLAAYVAIDFDVLETLFGLVSKLESLEDDDVDLDPVFGALFDAFAQVGARAVDALSPIEPSSDRGRLLKTTTVGGYTDYVAGAKHVSQGIAAAKKGQKAKARRLTQQAEAELERAAKALEAAAKLVGFSLV